MPINTDNDELVGRRDFYRGFARHMDRLADGKVEKIVVTKNGKMQAVVLTAEKYEALTDGKA